MTNAVARFFRGEVLEGIVEKSPRLKTRATTIPETAAMMSTEPDRLESQITSHAFFF